MRNQEPMYLVRDHLSGKEREWSKRMVTAMMGRMHNDRPRYEILSSPTEATVVRADFEKKNVVPLVAEPVADNLTNQEVAEKLGRIRSLSGLDKLVVELGSEAHNWRQEIDQKEAEIKEKIKQGGENE